MANEATKILDSQKWGESVNTNSVGQITKGTLMYLTDENNAYATTAQTRGGGTLSGAWGGIASSDKVSGASRVTLEHGGVFDLTLNASNVSVSIGDPIVFSGANLVDKASVAESESGAHFGFSQAASGAASGEVIRVRVFR